MTHPTALVVGVGGEAEAAALERDGFVALPARSGADALSKATAARPDAVVIDGGLSDMDPFDLARALRAEAGLDPATPILVTAPHPPTAGQHLAALRAGVWEILVQPYEAADVARRCAAHLRDGQAAAGADPDTGFYDPEGLDRRVRELAARASHHRAPLACIVLAPDVSAGDSAGEELRVSRAVSRTAETLRSNHRSWDAVGLLGPAEFAVVAPGTDARGALAFAERLLRAAAGVTLRAGCDAVANARTAAIAPARLLARAARALQRSRVEGTRIATLAD
jgi:PleD family two-component response regulator